MALTKISNTGLHDDAIRLDSINDESIDEVRLKISNAGSNGEFLSKQSGNTGGLTWATVSQTDTTYTHTFVDSSNDAIIRLTAGGSGSGNDDLKFVAGSNITLTPSGDNLTIASTDTNTTYSVGDGGLTQNNFTNTLKSKLDGITASANNYVHPNHSGEVTSSADGATVIASNIVDEDNLKISNSGSDGQYLQKQSGNTGGLTWASPAGGAGGATGLDVNDNVKIRFGTGNDLQIWHNGSNSFIEDSGTGALYIDSNHIILRKYNTSEVLAQFISDGAVELYYDNVKRFETASGGNIITGWLQVNSGHVNVTDSNAFRCGDSQDLQIFHDGTNSFIDNNTGNIKIRPTGTELGAVFVANGAVKLYYDNSKKFETVSDGVKLAADNSVLYIGAGGDLRMWHNGTHSIIKNITGSLYAASSAFLVQNAAQTESQIISSENGAVELFYDNSKKLNTASDGIDVLGDVDIAAGAIFLEDNYKLHCGTGNDLQIYHTGSFSKIENATGDLNLYADTNVGIYNAAGSETKALFATNGAVKLYYDNAKHFETTATGVSWGTTRLRCDDNGMIELGTGQDLQIYHDGSYSYIDNTHSGGLWIRGGTSTYQIGIQAKNSENSILCTGNGSVELYYDASKKFETSAYGTWLGDNSRVTLGGSTGTPDCHFYADGTDTNIQNIEGDLIIKSTSGGAKAIVVKNGAAVELYHNNTKKLETSATGVTIPNTLTVSDGANLDGDIKFKGSGNGDDFFWDKSADQLTLTDSRKIRFGDSGDLEIYHNGSHSFLENQTGSIYIRGFTSGEGVHIQGRSGEASVVATYDGSVELHYDGSKKLETRSDGLQVDGTVRLPADNSKLLLGAGLDLEIYHNGTDSVIANGTNKLKITSSANDIVLESGQVVIKNAAANENLAYFEADGGCGLYYDNSKKLETTSAGGTLHGTWTGAGSFVQVKSTTTTAEWTGTVGSGSKVTVGGLNVDITPTSSSNKILVFCTLSGHNGLEAFQTFVVMRDSTEILLGDDNETHRASASGLGLASGIVPGTMTVQGVDNPSTTSQITYSVKVVGIQGSGNRTVRVNAAYGSRCSAVSTITVMEFKP